MHALLLTELINFMVQDNVIKLLLSVSVTFAIVNIISTKWGTRVQSIFSAAKVGALVVIILLGIVHLSKGTEEIL